MSEKEKQIDVPDLPKPPTRPRRSSPKRMTKYEKVSTITSLVAIILAIASPFISYYWLDPQRQAFRNRPHLTTWFYNGCAEEDNLKSNTNEPLVFSSSTQVQELIDCRSQLVIFNKSDLPARSVYIEARFGEEADEAYLQSINVTSLIGGKYQTEVRRSLLRIELLTPIASNGAAIFDLSKTPDLLFVANEFGDLTVSSTVVGDLKRFLKQGTVDVTRFQKVGLIGPVSLGEPQVLELPDLAQ